MDILAAVEGSAVAAALRQSVWAYPLVNTAHIAGVALLFGAIVPLDLRLLGVWRHQPLDVLAPVLIPTAASGLLLAVIAGSLLFSVGATTYATSYLFLAKMGLVAVGAGNAFALRRTAAWQQMLKEPEGPRRKLLAASALGSLAAWSGALLLGRLVGYF